MQSQKDMTIDKIIIVVRIIIKHAFPLVAPAACVVSFLACSRLSIDLFIILEIDRQWGEGELR